MAWRDGRKVGYFLRCRPSRPDSQTEFGRCAHVTAGSSAELLSRQANTRLVLRQREGDRKSRPSASASFGPDFAMVRLYQTLDYCQSEAKALRPRSAVDDPIEGVEQMWQRGVRNARSAIRNGNGNRLA